MVNIKGGALISLVINTSAWTLGSLWFADTRKTWLVFGFLILTMLGFVIMLSSIFRYILNLKTNPMNLARLSLSKSLNKMKKLLAIITVALVSAVGAANYNLHFGNGADPISAESLLNPDRGIISLTFDDANASFYDHVIPELTKKEQTGTLYVPSGFVGKQGFMSWGQVKEVSEMGFEIGGHTVNHAELPKLSTGQVRRELKENYDQLRSRGITATDFAAPFGAYDNNTIAEVAKIFYSQRAFKNHGLNLWPYNKYLIYVRPVTKEVGPETVKQWIDEAVVQKQWLVLVFHEVLPDASVGDSFSWPVSNLNEILDYMNEKDLKSRHVNSILTSFNNLHTNSSFTSGLTTWKIDNSPYMLVDGSNFGSQPSPRQSLRIIGSTKNSHLFGPKLAVSPDTQYGIRAYLDTRRLSRGEIGFYVDEYDSLNNWISGQWLGGVQSKNVIDYSYRYKPTSTDVAFASVQVYATEGTSGVSYLDNLEFFTSK